MRNYIATFRAGINASDDATAMIRTEDIIDAVVDNILYHDDGEDFVLTQLTDFAPADTPQEAINVLIKARNTLIKSRLQAMINLAMELDKVIFSLENGDWEGIMPYNYRFMDLMKTVLDGGSPA